MELNKEKALQVAELFIDKVKSYSNFYYIVVGYDKTEGKIYADDQSLCPNDRESDKIALKPGEFLVKVYDKKLKRNRRYLGRRIYFYLKLCTYAVRM